MTDFLELTADPFVPYRGGSELEGSIYAAGYPSYPANFSRDALMAGIISGRPDLLYSQLEMSVRHQGVEDNHLTGERPGKVHHEVPGAQLAGRGEGFTTYNACDTTALFLIAAEGLSGLDEIAASAFIDKRRESLNRASNHILSLLNEEDNLYWDKGPETDTGYTLKVTYWKDSILPHVNGKTEPVYPITFGQAHFIAARGLLSAGRILGRPDYLGKADAMYRAGIDTFMQTDGYVVYKDNEGELRQSSSDELHSLAYIPPEYADLLPIDAIRRRAKSLATPFGYMCTPPLVARQLADKYHGDKIWVFEQAGIHYGSKKFGLIDEAETAGMIKEHIGEGQELFGVDNLEDGTMCLVPEGNDRQLWSVAAAEYFSDRSPLSNNSWL